MRWLYWAMPLLFLAAPAVAGWDKTPAGTGDRCEIEKPNPTKQRRCWWNFSGTGTGYSNMLVIDQCENYSIRLYPDIDGTETNVTVNVLICGDGPLTTNVPNACFVLEGKTLNSSIPAVYGADGTFLIADIVAACGATANCRMEFACNQ